MTCWVLLMLAGFAGSALYSGMETGSYTINRVRLHVQADRGKRGAMALRRLLDQPATLLSTLLIGNNVANYLGTAGLAVLLEAMALSDWQTILLNTLIVTPLLFVFGETLPKDTMAAHSDRLMTPLAPLLQFSRWLFTVTGLVPLIRLFSGVVMRLIGSDVADTVFTPRRRVELLVREGVGHGLLSDEQSAIVDRVLRLSGRRVKQEMIDWKQVLTVRADDPPQKLRELADRSSRSRYPVVDANQQVIGVVDVFDVLLHPADGCPPIRELMVQPDIISPEMPLRAALRQLQQSGSAIAIVTDKQRPVGVVTIKDLVEPITGELASW